MSKVALMSMGERIQDQKSCYLQAWLNKGSAFNDVNTKPDENVNDKREEKMGNSRSMTLLFHASYMEDHIP
jgi:hypothetical protein